MYINRIYEVGSYVFNLCAKGDVKVKLGVKKLILSFLHPYFKRNLFYKFISGTFHTCGDARDDFYTTVVHFFDKLIQVLRAHDFHGQSTSYKI